jgi:outer membrane receptor for ferric coprogen and ferric-rhodotorulic acid
VTLPVEAFGRSHEIDRGRRIPSMDKDFTYGGQEYFDINVYDPGGINIPKHDYQMVNGNQVKSWQYGVYGRTKISATDWLDVILGSRVTWFESEGRNANAFFNNFTNTETNIDRKVIPYAALVAKLTPELSAYASYTSVFKPQTDVDASGKPIDPREGEQYELGLKREFLDGRLNGSVALFTSMTRTVRRRWSAAPTSRRRAGP